jgi:hypothetical protein
MLSQLGFDFGGDAYMKFINYSQKPNLAFKPQSYNWVVYFKGKNSVTRL